MTIEEIKSENRIQLNVEGKIDTISYMDFQNAVLKSFQKSHDIVINMEQVQYISSAGLRALFLGQKTASSKGGSLKIINVPDSVKDIFRVTGFEKVLDIR